MYYYNRIENQWEGIYAGKKIRNYTFTRTRNVLISMNSRLFETVIKEATNSREIIEFLRNAIQFAREKQRKSDEPVYVQLSIEEAEDIARLLTNL